jgi:hypothetical protein
MNVVRTTSLLLLLSLVAALPAFGQDELPDDTVQVISQPGQNPYECCHSFAVFNRSKGSISDFRVYLIDEGGVFIGGQAGSPIEWNVFLDTRSAQWIPETNEAEIDSGESVTSFSVCIKDTGVYHVVWESWDNDGVRSRDTLTFICGPRNNCDQAFFTPVPSLFRCGFDIDLLNENGRQKKVNDLHLQVISAGFSIDTTGARVPDGWRIDRFDSSLIVWETSGDGLSVGDFVQDFRFYLNTTGSSVARVAWWTTNFGEPICTDTLDLMCGLRVPDTLFSRRTNVGMDSSCCRDFLLINSHSPRTPLHHFVLLTRDTGASLSMPDNLPDGWKANLSTELDTLFLSSDSSLAYGDSVVFGGICFDNNLAGTDSVRYQWRTEFEDVWVTGGGGVFYCFRDAVFCDSVEVQIDSTLGVQKRCIDLTVKNRNSRRDTIYRITAHIANEGAPRRILEASAPTGWSLDEFTDDSVTWHRGNVDPDFERSGFEFCVSTDTNAIDPMTIRWTTWGLNFRPICTDSIEVNAGLRLDCDSVVFSENDQSINPLCCYDVTLYNTNGKGRAIDRFEVRVPRVDLILDTAEASGSWMLNSDVFPAVAATFVGDTLKAGDSVTFTVCVNAIAVEERPFNYFLQWRTYSAGEQLCFDSVFVSCEGAPGECDSVILSRQPFEEDGCVAGYTVVNKHTPDGPVNNLQFRILSDVGDFTSAIATGDAAGFDDVTVSPQEVLFAGDVIPAGEIAGEFRLDLSADVGDEIIIEICTFEDDLELCCQVDTVTCVALSVDDERLTAGRLIQSVTPNPFEESSLVTYHLRQPGTVRYTLVDASGRTIEKRETGLQSSGDHALEIDGSDKPSGLYYAILESDGIREVVRIVVVQ